MFPRCRQGDLVEMLETKHWYQQGGSISGAFRFVVVVWIPVEGIEELQYADLLTAGDELFQGKGHGSGLRLRAADLDSSFQESGIDG